MNKYLWIAVVVIALVGGYAGGEVAKQFGSTTVNYNSSLNQALLYNSLASIVGDVQAVRAPLAGLVTSSTAALSFPALGPVGSTTSTNSTTTAPGLAALQGDIILVYPSTSTTGIVYNGKVVTPSSTSATFEITAMNASTTATTPAASQFFFTVLPRTSFVAPATLNTVTSTSN